MSREILLLSDSLAREKNVSKDVVFAALEMALASAVRKLMKLDDANAEIRVEIDRESGEHCAYRRWLVIEDEEGNLDGVRQISSTSEQAQSGGLQPGDYWEEALPSVDFGRIGAQVAKQVIFQQIRDAEREQILNDFLARGDGVISGVIKRLERGFAIVECGRLEAFLRRDQMIPKENLRLGDRVRMVVLNINRGAKGRQVEMSRVHPNLVRGLFEMEVPEISDGHLEIKAVARDPGLRAKVAVHTEESRIDPVGTCVGIRGSRVQSVMNELSGERLDIVLWSPEPAQFVVNALSPAEVASIVIDEDSHSMDVMVDEVNLAMAIGRNGQNVRLASELTGWSINLMTLDQRERKEEEEALRLQSVFWEALDVDEEVGGFLVEAGFSTVEEIAYVPEKELLDLGAFDAETVEVLQRRARDWLLTQAIASEERLGCVKEDLSSLEGMDRDLLAVLARNNVLSREDLAELSAGDLLDLTGMELLRAKELIMKARECWFSDEVAADAV